METKEQDKKTQANEAEPRRDPGKEKSAEKKDGKERRSQRVSAGGVVTERDQQACLWICEQGVMSVDQLWRAVWGGNGSRGPRYAYERVQFLERAGFIEGVKTPYSLKTYFRATRTGAGLAEGASLGFTSVPRGVVALNEIPHVDGLTELRLMVLRSGRAESWRTDRVLELDTSFPKERFQGPMTLPDALWVTKSGSRVAVEYERTRKEKRRIRDKVESLSRELARPDRLIDRVLWIVSPGCLALFEEQLQSHPSQTLPTLKQFASEIDSGLQAETAPRVSGGVL